MMDRKQFIETCRFILRTQGELVGKRSVNFYSSYKGDSELLKYEDDEIIIVGAVYDLSLSITRKENNNPVVYAKSDGEIFRSHGEQSHLFDHVAIISLQSLESRKEKEDEQQYCVSSTIDGTIYMNGSEKKVTEWLWKNATEKIKKI